MGVGPDDAFLVFLESEVVEQTENWLEDEDGEEDDTDDGVVFANLRFGMVSDV